MEEYPSKRGATEDEQWESHPMRALTWISILAGTTSQTLERILVSFVSTTQADGAALQDGTNQAEAYSSSMKSWWIRVVVAKALK